MGIKKFLIKHNIIKGTFCEQGLIYIENHKPSKEPTDIIKWLDEVSVHCYYKEKDKLLLNILEEKYPKYKGHIWLY